MERHVFVGHYLKLNFKKAEIETPYCTCPSEECVNHKKEIPGLYCSQCGTEIVSDLRKTVVKELTPSNLLPRYLVNGVTCKGDGKDRVWLITKNHHDVEGNDLGESDDGNHPIDFKQAEMERDSILERPYINDLFKYMNSQYGDNAISLEFGVYTYWLE